MTERVVRARVEPHPSRHFSKIKPPKSASVAQLVEQRTENPRVVGSIPTGGTTFADLAHLVERHLAKVEVAGSSPVIRSKVLGRNSEDFFIQVADLVYHHRMCIFLLLDDIQGFRLDFSWILLSKIWILLNI